MNKKGQPIYRSWIRRVNVGATACSCHLKSLKRENKFGCGKSFFSVSTMRFLPILQCACILDGSADQNKWPWLALRSFAIIWKCQLLRSPVIA